MYSQSLVEEQLQQEELKEELLRLEKKLKSLVLERQQKTVVTGVEMFRKLLDEGQAGDNVGFFFEVRREKILNEVSV